MKYGKVFKKTGVLLGCFLCAVLLSGFFSKEIKAEEKEEVGCYEYDFLTGEETYEEFENFEVKNGEILDGYEGQLPAEEDEDSMIRPYTIFGKDERKVMNDTTVIPLRWIGQIESHWKGGRVTIGSAWLYGEQVAVTSGHCIYDSDNGGYPESIIFYPGRNGSKLPYGSVKITKAKVTSTFKKYEGSKRDAGIVKLASPIGKKLGYFGIQYIEGKTAYIGKYAWVTGYPGEKNGKMYRMGGDITSSDDLFLYYHMDTTKGQSGCPVYIKNGDKRTVIAINGWLSNFENIGIRIDKTLYNWLKNTKSNWK